MLHFRAHAGLEALLAFGVSTLTLVRDRPPDANSKLKFYQVLFNFVTFELHKHEVSTDRVIQCGVTPAVALIFGRVVPAWRSPPGATPIAAPEPDEGPPYFY